MSLKVQCPTCGATVEWSKTNAWRPFCSERCKVIDLGAWASESYRVAAEESEPSESDLTPQATRAPGRQ
jgi:hypothetical protein